MVHNLVLVWLAVAVLYGLLGAVLAFKATVEHVAYFVGRAVRRYRFRRRLRQLCR